MIDSPFICVGDRTTCGGVVAQGNPTFDIHGVPVSFATARIACQKNCIIANGSPTDILDGRQIASFLFSTSSAGCKFVPSQRASGNEIDPASSSSDTGAAAGVADLVIPVMEDMQELLEPLDFVELRLVDQRQQPIGGEAFKLSAPGREVIEGTLDAHGYARVGNVPRGKCLVWFERFGLTYSV